MMCALDLYVKASFVTGRGGAQTVLIGSTLKCMRLLSEIVIA